MDKINLLAKGFDRIGARVKFGGMRWSPRVEEAGRVSIDVRKDKEGEFFEIRMDPDANLEVIDVQPKDRHLVLMSKNGKNGRFIKDKFLCGHDERHWFAAAVPEDNGRAVRDVQTAKINLKPEVGLVNYIRQGEWFFVPEPGINPDPREILKKEPLSRGNGSKPHVCDEMYRTGGVAVWINRRHPAGVERAEYERLLADGETGWRIMVRDATVYVRGAVRHSDHKTVRLDVWHHVYMNRERFARAAKNVVFLD